MYNIHVCTTTDDDDDDRSRLISVDSFAFCLPFLAAYRLNISLKKHLQKLVSHKRAPHKKERRQRIVFSLFLLHIYVYI